MTEIDTLPDPDIEPRLNVVKPTTPDVRGCYPFFDYVNNRRGWYFDTIGYYVWSNAAHTFYFLADTYPDDPAVDELHWSRQSDSPIGRYLPLGGAVGDQWCFYAWTKKEQGTTWHWWGTAKRWLIRAGTKITLTGQAMFPRTTWPPWFVRHPFDVFPRPKYEVPIPDSQSCCWRPSDKVITYYEHWDNPPAPDEHSGIKIFQVNPRSAEASYERKHTRIVGDKTPWPGTDADNFLSFYAHWKPPPGTHVRYFARAWHHMRYRHIVPIYTTICPGTLLVTGDPNPNCTGIYHWAGIYNGEHYFKHKDQSWYVFASLEVPAWGISDLPPASEKIMWGRDPGMEGIYTTTDGTTGHPVVELIPGEDP